MNTINKSRYFTNMKKRSKKIESLERQIEVYKLTIERLKNKLSLKRAIET